MRFPIGLVLVLGAMLPASGVPRFDALFFDGDVAPGGGVLQSAGLERVVLSDTGESFFRQGDRVYSAAPGSLSLQLSTASQAPDGRVFTSISGNSISISKSGNIAFAATTTLPNGSAPELGLFLKRPTGIVVMARSSATLTLDSAFPTWISENGNNVAFLARTPAQPGGVLYNFRFNVNPNPHFVTAVGTGLSGSTITSLTEPATLASVRVDNGFSVFLRPQTSDPAGPFPLSGSSTFNGSTGRPVLWHNPYSGRLMVEEGEVLRLFSPSSTVSTPLVTVDGGAPGPMLQPSIGPDDGVAFATPGGIYRTSAAGRVAIALTGQVPGGGSALVDVAPTGAGPVPARGGTVFFEAADAVGRGLFSGDGSRLDRHLGAGDLLQERLVEQVHLFPDGGSPAGSCANGASQIAVRTTFSGGGGGLFRMTTEDRLELAVTGIPNGGTQAYPATQIDMSAPANLVLSNVGNLPLTEVSAAISGPDAGMFVISSPASLVIQPGKTSSLRLLFRPTRLGSLNATLTITAAGLAVPYVIQLSGTCFAGGAPEIDILGPNGMPFLSVPAIVNFGGVRQFETVAFTFTLRNRGAAALKQIAAVIEESTDFTLQEALPTELPGSSETTFTILLNTSVAGSKFASLKIASNDANENPYRLIFHGAVVRPELQLSGDDFWQPFPDGGSLPGFGNVVVGNSVEQNFRLRNSGGIELQELEAVFSNPAFSLVTPLPASLPVGAYADLILRFTPPESGDFSGSLALKSNWSGGNHLEVMLDGTGIPQGQPELVVIGPDSALLPAAGGVIDFGPVTVGDDLGRTIGIRNDGDTPLRRFNTILTKGKGNPFQLRDRYQKEIAPGEVVFVTVEFRPVKAGNQESTLTLVSNDLDEPKVVIRLMGTGLIPEMAVEGPDGADLPDGRGAVGFGVSEVGVAVDREIVIRNVGTATLTLGSAGFKGGKAADFSVVTSFPVYVAAGASARLTLRCIPGAAGKRGTRLMLMGNDPDESPFDLVLNCTGVRSPVALAASVTGPGEDRKVALEERPTKSLQTEFYRFETSFVRLDLDRSGSLTPAELLLHYPQDTPYPAILSEFKRLDQDEDFLIAPAEWLPRHLPPAR